MNFGYFLNQNNLGLGKPFDRVIAEGRDIAQYCDRTGWHSIWNTEHHFGHEGLEVCPNPVMMSTDLASRTERIRIGQAATDGRLDSTPSTTTPGPRQYGSTRRRIQWLTPS